MEQSACQNILVEAPTLQLFKKVHTVYLSQSFQLASPPEDTILQVPLETGHYP